MSNYEHCHTTDPARGQCLRRVGHAGEHDFPISPAEQAANYAIAKDEYDSAMGLWKDNGRFGPPPPRPVPPHTPGWTP